MYNLKKLRQKDNLSQKQLAEELNLSPARYNHYEIGRSQPDFETLKKISNYFNVSLDYLLDNSEVEMDHSLSKAIIEKNTKISLPVYKKILSFKDFNEQNIIAHENAEESDLMGNIDSNYYLFYEFNNLNSIRLVKGDLLHLSRDCDYSEGKIVLVAIDGYSLLKKLSILNDKIILSDDINETVVINKDEFLCLGVLVLNKIKY